MPDTQTDPVQARLITAPVPNSVRADAWDAFQQSKDADELAQRLAAIKIPDNVKADLWDMKHAGGPNAPMTQVQTPQNQSDSGGLALAGTAAALKSLPKAANVMEEIASRPGMTEGIVGAASTAVGLGMAAKDLYEGRPLDAAKHAVEGAGAPVAIKVLRKLAGNAVPDAADALTTGLGKGATFARVIAPYAQAITTASGAQGLLDLAQMVDKKRKDIGTLGVSLDPEQRSQTDKDAHPALINAVASKIGELSSQLAAQGIQSPDAVAVKLLSDGSSALFGRLMSMFMKSK